ncbi:hypothetical protein BDZ97DRAFT_1752709 [Flammula alnicola]|nr:hypothetical protein BDZ97DRAFT_1752709 [Flammula alnicola]
MISPTVDDAPIALPSIPSSVRLVNDQTRQTVQHSTTDFELNSSPACARVMTLPSTPPIAHLENPQIQYTVQHPIHDFETTSPTINATASTLPSTPAVHLAELQTHQTIQQLIPPSHFVLNFRVNSFDSSRHGPWYCLESLPGPIIYVQHAVNCFCMFQSFCATIIYHRMFCFKGIADLDAAESGGLSLSEETASRWETTLNRISSGWKMILSGATLVLLPSLPGMLQLQPIFNNALSRTFVIASLLLTCASFICSLLYIGFKRSFLTPRMVDQWKAAADHNSEFWRLIALPLSFIIWAVIFFIAAVLFLAWSGIAGSSSDTTVSPGAGNAVMPLSGIFITSMFVVCVAKVYFAINRLLADT